MTRPAFLTLATISLGACASGAAAAPPDAVLLAAHLLADKPLQSAIPGGPRSPLRRVEAANRSAVREPSAELYLGAVQVYPWSEGALYRLYTAPGQVSEIALQPGEVLNSVAAGDTARWVIGDTASGTGAARRTHILIKPSASGLRTNLVIATDRRVYHLELASSAGPAMASISWNYPEDTLLALKAAAAPEPPASADIAVEALNFNYRIDGDKVPWRPLRAFDDGRQLFIEFPPTLGQSEAPPLFVRGQDGRIELVNFRLRGHYYVVDRLVAAAELRLGEKRQQVVRIVRDGAPRRGKGS